MMISTKLSLPTLALVLVVFTVFTVSLTETIQISDGFSAVSKNFVFDMQRGETQIDTWKIVNDSPKKTWVEFYTIGDGGDLILFGEVLEMEPSTSMFHEFIISIPKDHPDNVTYKPDIVALKRGDPVGYGVTGAQVNLELKTQFIINIGDNPIYTPPVEAKIVEETPPAKIIPAKEAAKAQETLDEKMAKIKAANEALESTQEEKVTTPEVTTQENNYVEEPKSDPEPVAEIKAVDDMNGEEDGGCLIATAAFGTELAPQVQFLREIRDNTVMSTGVGASFMTGFNTLYYSFSPTIADMERENPMFQEAVRVFITPMISTLSIMTLAEEGNDVQVLGLGISVIALNLGLYIAAPAVTGFAISKRLRN